MNSFVKKSISTLFTLGILASANVTGATGLNVSAKLPDYVPVNVGTNHQCRLTAVFKNAGPGSQLAAVTTMDLNFLLKGDFYYNNVHYTSKKVLRPDLVLNVMHPGATKAFVMTPIRIAGPTRVTFIVNDHAGGGLPEMTKANNTMIKTVNCAGNLKKKVTRG